MIIFVLVPIVAFLAGWLGGARLGNPKLPRRRKPNQRPTISLVSTLYAARDPLEIPTVKRRQEIPTARS